MGRSINKKFFGDSDAYDILVSFYKDGGAVTGFIVKQTGTARFICQDAAGDRRLCYLVAKPGFALAPGEMCITVSWNGDSYLISKITQHKVTINGGEVPWSFDNNLNPGTAQVPDYAEAPVLYLGTNSYITFGQGSDRYSDLNYDYPELPKIMVSGDDNSMQSMYYGVTGTAPNRVYVVRYQGTDSTSGDPENPTMVIEYHFPEAHKDQIEIHIISNARYPGGDYTGVASANAELATFDPIAGNAYVWSDTLQSISSIPLNEHGSAGLEYINFDGGEGGGNPWDDISSDDGFAGFFIPWTVRFNGTDWSA